MSRKPETQSHRVTLSVTLSVEQRRRLEELAAARGLTVSQYTRLKLLRQRDMGGPARVRPQRRTTKTRADRFDWRDTLESA